MAHVCKQNHTRAQDKWRNLLANRVVFDACGTRFQFRSLSGRQTSHVITRPLQRRQLTASVRTTTSQRQNKPAHAQCNTPTQQVSRSITSKRSTAVQAFDSSSQSESDSSSGTVAGPAVLPMPRTVPSSSRPRAAETQPTHNTQPSRNIIDLTLLSSDTLNRILAVLHEQDGACRPESEFRAKTKRTQHTGNSSCDSDSSNSMRFADTRAVNASAARPQFALGGKQSSKRSSEEDLHSTVPEFAMVQRRKQLSRAPKRPRLSRRKRTDMTFAFGRSNSSECNF